MKKMEKVATIEYDIPAFLLVKSKLALALISDSQLDEWRAEVRLAIAENEAVYEAAVLKIKQLIQDALEIFGAKHRIYQYLHNTALLALPVPPPLQRLMDKLEKRIADERAALKKRQEARRRYAERKARLKAEQQEQDEYWAGYGNSTD